MLRTAPLRFNGDKTAETDIQVISRQTFVAENQIAAKIKGTTCYQQYGTVSYFNRIHEGEILTGLSLASALTPVDAGFVQPLLKRPDLGDGGSSTPKQCLSPEVPMQQQKTIEVEPHGGPHLGMLAIFSTVLFSAGEALIRQVPREGHFPSPFQSSQATSFYFQHHQTMVLLCALLQFVSAIPLGVFSATVYSRMNYLGVRAAGASIALLGGLAASLAVGFSSLMLWVMAQAGVAQDGGLTQAFHLLRYAVGGAGYAVGLAHLMAGTSASTLFERLAPRWIAIPGFSLAAMGMLSCFSLYFPTIGFLVPVTRFCGFLWMIAMGFLLPRNLPSFLPDHAQK